MCHYGARSQCKISFGLVYVQDIKLKTMNILLTKPFWILGNLRKIFFQKWFSS